MARRLRLIAPGCLLILSVPLALIAFDYYIIGLFTPTFPASFRVVNDSGADVWITPIGMWEVVEDYGPLPKCRNGGSMDWPFGRKHDIRLKRDRSLTFTYERSNIDFRHILVRTESGDVFIIDAKYRHGDPAPTCSIPPLAELPRAPAELIPCTRGERIVYSPPDESRDDGPSSETDSEGGVPQ